MSEIHLPNSDTGGKNTLDTWGVVSDSAKTQKQAIENFQEYLSRLSKKTKEIDEKVQEIDQLKEEIIKIKQEAGDSLKITHDTRGLVFFGWFALVFVVIGIAFGYWMFVKDSVKNDDLKFGITQKISEQEKELEKLKVCLLGSKWLNPKCLE